VPLRILARPRHEQTTTSFCGGANKIPDFLVFGHQGPAEILLWRGEGIDAATNLEESIILWIELFNELRGVNLPKRFGNLLDFRGFENVAGGYCSSYETGVPTSRQAMKLSGHVPSSSK
jgi:hypothetical protein